MTLPAELRAEADRLESYSHHPDETRALLHRAADALEWRGIESAPKDRSVLLLDSDGAMVSGKFYALGTWQTDEDMCGYFYCPTHWMEKPELDAPLPATPEGDNNSTNDEERV